MKQQVGFDEDGLDGCMRRRNIPEDGLTSGIILDEMSIQSDIQVCKKCDMVELSELGEIGESNICHTIRSGKNEKYIGTYALQMVFLPISGL